ncbi:unnamed protein product [Adineta ricciae]|nr:unnamed protein product [Adineta ricciae]
MVEQSPSSEIILDHRNDLSDANSVDSAFSIDSGVVASQDLHEYDSSSSTAEKLFYELQRVKEDLKYKDHEILRANQIRESTDREIEDLTTSLFESAHAMVDQAKQAQANAEQKLKVSNQTIDALVLENVQLKKSISELKQILSSCRTSMDMSPNHNHIDEVLLREFTSWDENPSIERDASLFIYRVYNEDILPCLSFPNTELSSKVLEAIENNCVTMEVCHSTGNLKMCSLMGEVCQCDFRIRLSEDGLWYFISRLARNRIASVCDFFTFVRHVQSGLVKSSTEVRFDRILERRKQMAFARLGL